MIYETLWTGVASGLLISMLEKLNYLRFTGLITLVLLMWKWMGLFLKEKHLLRCWGWLSLLNWIGALICPMKFLSPEVALYLYKSTIRPCIEYCCHAWAGAPSCYLNCWISHKNGYAGLLVLHLLPLIKMSVFSIGIIVIMFIGPGWTGSIYLTSREVYSLSWQIV